MINYVIELLRRNKAYFVPFVIFMFVGGYWVFNIAHGTLVLFLDDFHHQMMDYIFYGITFFGSGWFFLSIIVLFAFFRFYYSLMALCCFALNTIFVQLSKRVLFTDQLRPKTFFGDRFDLNYVEWIDVHTMMSFPSGHTTTAFSISIIILFISKRVNVGILLFLYALTVGISRIYLHQHFFRDVYAGAMLGVFTALTSYILIRLTIDPDRYNWLNLSLKKLMSRGA